MSDKIPIFDSLTHPTLTGTWLNSGADATFNSLTKSLNENQISKAFSVGIFGVEEYEHISFIKNCKKDKRLIPIAGIDVFSNDISNKIKKIKELGYTGVKLHPRFGNFNLTDNRDLIINILKECYTNNLIVLFCTYFSTTISHYPTKDPYWDLVKVLKGAPNTKIILLHGGGTRLLLYADLVRFNNHLILDLSYTIIKYKGSSLEQDIKYLFKTFDRKLCIGSDHPEFSQSELRICVEELSKEISNKKKENIYYKNLTRFINE